MQNERRERQRKSYVTMRMIYDIGMGAFIFLIGIVMIFGDKFKMAPLTNLVLNMEPLIRYLFGGLCLLYGSFRLYRGIKHEY